jgi:hypothetical protein
MFCFDQGRPWISVLHVEACSLGFNLVWYAPGGVFSKILLIWHHVSYTWGVFTLGGVFAPGGVFD